MPSFNLYRGALLAMLVGTALAVFLIVRPPGESGDAAPVVVNNARATPTTSARRDATVPAETPAREPRPRGTPPQDATPPVTATPARDARQLRDAAVTTDRKPVRRVHRPVRRHPV